MAEPALKVAEEVALREAAKQTTKLTLVKTGEHVGKQQVGRAVARGVVSRLVTRIGAGLLAIGAAAGAFITIMLYPREAGRGSSRRPTAGPKPARVPTPNPVPDCVPCREPRPKEDDDDDDDDREEILIHGTTEHNARAIVEGRKFQGKTYFVLGRGDQDLAVWFAQSKSQKYPRQGGPQLVVIQIYESDRKRFQSLGLIQRRRFDEGDDPKLLGKTQYILLPGAADLFSSLVLEWKRESTSPSSIR